VIDAQEALQTAIVSAVKASAAMGALIGDRIYDKVPTRAAVLFPYVAFRGMDSVDASDACHDGVEVFVDLDGWSREVGTIEAKRIAAALALLLDAPLTVTGFEVITHEVTRCRTLKEEGDLHRRADVQLRYVLAPTA
jgi:hypothetical protein